MSGNKKNMGLIRRFIPYFKKYKWVLVLDLFCAALTTVCELVLPLIVPPPAETNSTGTLAPRTAIGSDEINPSGTPSGSGIEPNGCGRRSSVIYAWVRTYSK